MAKMHNLYIVFFHWIKKKHLTGLITNICLKTLEAFGFGPYFVSLIKMLYNEIYSMLKIMVL